MKTYVVDACVAIKWFVPEIHKEAARRLRNPSYQLHVPNLFLVEFGNIVCKKLRRKEINLEVGNLIISQVQNASLEWHQDDLLFLKAFEIANQTDRSLYDCLYLSLAISLEGKMVTADLRFYNALKNGDYAEWLLWVEDIPKDKQA